MIAAIYAARARIRGSRPSLCGRERVDGCGGACLVPPWTPADISSAYHVRGVAPRARADSDRGLVTLHLRKRQRGHTSVFVYT
jgi:hypothetical protein